MTGTENVHVEIDTWFEKRKAELIRDLKGLIAVRSVQGEPGPGMPYGEGPAAAVKEAALILKNLGFETENFENRVLTADLNSTAPVLGILCHLDTVSEGDGWFSDPYRAEIRDGRLYGRGASDDKGPAVAAMYALAAAREIAPELTKGCRLILGSSEETGHDDLHHYRSVRKMPPNVFTPDADYPLVNLEKGRFFPTFSAAWTSDGALPRVVSLTGGDTGNKVPPKAEAVVEGLPLSEIEKFCGEYSEKTGAKLTAAETDGAVRVTSSGKAAHAAEPENGVNAQTALLALLSALPLADSALTRSIRALGRIFPHGDTTGKALGIDMTDELSGALTVNFGVLTVTGTGLTGNCDCRLPLGSTVENTDDVLTKALAGAGFKVEDAEKTPVHHTPAETKLVRTLLREFEAYTGMKGECLSMGGQTYVHDIEGGVAFGCAFPGIDYRLHGANEFIGLDEIMLSAKMFTQAIIDMCL